MAQFWLRFDTDNAAFEDNPSMEISRILSNLSNDIENGKFHVDGTPLFDINGNKVGHAYWDDALGKGLDKDD